MRGKKVKAAWGRSQLLDVVNVVIKFGSPRRLGILEQLSNIQFFKKYLAARIYLFKLWKLLDMNCKVASGKWTSVEEERPIFLGVIFENLIPKLILSQQWRSIRLQRPRGWQGKQRKFAERRPHFFTISAGRPVRIKKTADLKKIVEMILPNFVKTLKYWLNLNDHKLKF